MSGTKAIVKISAMGPDIEQDCIDCAAYALLDKKLTEQRAIAQFIKRELDRKYGTVWHVIVGLSFGSYVSHDDQSFLYFFIGDNGFLIWRTESLPTKTVTVDDVIRQRKVRVEQEGGEFKSNTMNICSIDSDNNYNANKMHDMGSG
eukprot:Tbor_TRINITY_DN5750_c3_g6::TRINITY_DN5750_c3_g6_i2::g.19541::m.19541/K10418/DYNLL; dynein light chain LC8-type